MAVNPYTLNSLYQHGIIDYVDPELCAGQVAAPIAMNNPYANYINTAMQGNLYQNYGTQSDSFNYTGNNIYNSGAIGSKSEAFSNMMFGDKSIGTRNNSDVLGMGDPSIGAYYQGGFESAHGGFSDVKNNIYGGAAKATSIYNSVPDWLKGVLAVGIGILGIKMLFKGKGKKGGSFWSKLNPVNWFKKQPAQQPAPTPVKKSFWSKLKFWK